VPVGGTKQHTGVQQFSHLAQRELLCRAVRDLERHAALWGRFKGKPPGSAVAALFVQKTPETQETQEPGRAMDENNQYDIMH
jgi:hypothetical protein